MKKVLLIDDEKLLRINAKELLEFKGYEVYDAENGEIGIEKARTINPDVIVCDIMMSPQNGYDVKRKLNSSPKTARIPFVFLTAKAAIDDLRYGMDAGADDYLFKPFKIEALVHSIEARMRRAEQIGNPFPAEETKHGKKFGLKDKILIPVNNSSSLINISELVMIEAAGSYCKVYIRGGKTAMMRKILKDWESVLPSDSFLRVHRSKIINLNYTEKIDKIFNKTYSITLNGINEPVIVSQRYSKILKDRISV